LKLLDANIFFYALGAPHPLKDACLAILAAAEQKPYTFNIDTEIVQEILHVYNRRGERLIGVQAAEKLLQAFPQVLPITAIECQEAIRLMRRYPLSPRDAIHAAVVITGRLEGIVSTDEALAQIAEIRCYHPREILH
jgi:predicted nucleic acid-binding protein